MREGKSGIYFAEGGTMGFSLCMMNVTQMNSYYWDPYLLAVRRTADLGDAVREPLYYGGYETDARWMTLRQSGVRMRCVERGFLLQPPSEAAHLDPFNAACAAFDISDDYLVKVAQTTQDGVAIDVEDRIELGARLLASFVAAGL
jgi:hypothetical protein